MIPLLSPKPFSAYLGDTYRDYITSLYREPPKPPPPAEFSARLGKKAGSVTITVRRKPKWLSYGEATKLSQDVGVGYQDFLEMLRKRKIELKREEWQRGKK